MEGGRSARISRAQANIESPNNPFRQRIPFYTSVKGISPFEHGVPSLNDSATQPVEQFKPRRTKRKPLKPEPVRMDMVERLQSELSEMVGNATLEDVNREGLRFSPRSGRVLPPHWTVHFDGEFSRTFYHNQVNGTSQWNFPEEAAAPEAKLVAMFSRRSSTTSVS